MRFLSKAWLAALDAAARDRHVPDDDPLAGVVLRIDQIVTDGPSYRMVIDGGRISVVARCDGDPDLRFTTDRATAASIASGRRAALDAFINGDLVLGGDTALLAHHRDALEAVGDLFASVHSETEFD